jgi:hypothetical protein
MLRQVDPSWQDLLVKPRRHLKGRMVQKQSLADGWRLDGLGEDGILIQRLV